MCSPLARPVVQPASPPFCAARQPAENSCFSFGNTALPPARPAVRLVSSIQYLFNTKFMKFHVIICFSFYEILNHENKF